MWTRIHFGNGSGKEETDRETDRERKILYSGTNARLICLGKGRIGNVVRDAGIYRFGNGYMRKMS